MVSGGLSLFLKAMDFDIIPDQEALISTVVQQVNAGRWPHASLMYGPKGAATLAFALSVARCLMITGAREEYKENTAEKMDKLVHPDAHLIFPVQGDKSTSDNFLKEWREMVLGNPYMSISDWASVHATQRGNVNINVKECNNVIQKLSLKAFEGGNKVLVMWGAEFLGNNGNRLLKLLEEPPENTFIILVTEDLERILPTIISRCQIYRLTPVDEKELASFVADRFGIDNERADRIVKLTDGDLSRIAAMTQDRDNVLDFDTGRWIKILRDGNFEAMLGFAEEFSRWTKEQQKLIFMGALSKLRRSLTGIEPDDVIFAQILGDPIDLEIVNDLSGSFTRIIAGLELWVVQDVLVGVVVNQKDAKAMGIAAQVVAIV